MRDGPEVLKNIQCLWVGYFGYAPWASSFVWLMRHSAFGVIYRFE